jgi:hypothetical protein
MVRFALAAAVALTASAACRISLDEEDDSGMGSGARQCRVQDNTACNAAEGQASLTWIQANIFDRNCGGGSCHGNVANPGGRLVLAVGSHAKLVGAASMLAAGRTLVVPGNVAQSYLMVLLRHVPLAEADPAPAPAPTGAGYMPPNNEPICCQKIDAIVRWIEAGAPNN